MIDLSSFIFVQRTKTRYNAINIKQSIKPDSKAQHEALATAFKN